MAELDETNFGVDEEPMSYKGTHDARRPAAPRRRCARPAVINLWHDLPPGPHPPEEVTAVIEIPSGSRNKYELDKATGHA